LDLNDVGEVNKVYRICEPGPEFRPQKKCATCWSKQSKKKTGRQDVKERTDAIGIAA
jgi:hypothetical protein